MASPIAQSSKAATSEQELGVALSLRAVSYCYPHGGQALDGIDLEVRTGEKIVILGANGSGKSTLLKIFGALAYSTSGTFNAFGREVTEHGMRNPREASWFRRRVSLVFQNADAQLFSSTVAEELAFAPLQLGLSREECLTRVHDAARLVEVEHLLERAPYKLSAGEKRKVAIASILTMNPEVILMDEPTAGLDPRTRGKVLELLIQLNQAGKTLVTATHDLDLAPALADRVVVLNEEHSLVAEGRAMDILRNGKLLTSVNLIHEHMHRHGDLWHSHPHHHGGDHEHSHD